MVPPRLRKKEVEEVEKAHSEETLAKVFKQIKSAGSSSGHQGKVLEIVDLTSVVKECL